MYFGNWNSFYYGNSRNPNIESVTECEVQGPMKSRVCLSVKHTITNGRKCKGRSPMCHDPSFGLATKARACEGVGQEWSPHIHAPESVEECGRINPTLLNELPLWELESQWTPEFSQSDYRGQNPLNWYIFYIIGNMLEHRCLKWAHMTHLGSWNISYSQKKGQESNW
jgi:hypothetical protein